VFRPNHAARLVDLGVAVELEEMWKQVDQAMGKVYRRQDSIRNALLEAEQQTQRLLDADHARRR
jgi:hypothetical protein